MQGTSVDPTGVGIGGSTSSWAREPIQQTGGSVKRRARVTERKRRAQQGGFSPSIMGPFITNGMRLVPAVAYVGYKMLKNQKRTRKAARRGYKTRRN